MLMGEEASGYRKWSPGKALREGIASYAALAPVTGELNNRRQGSRPCPHWSVEPMSQLDLRVPQRGRRAPGGPPKAEPGADAGPAAPQAPP